MTYYAVIDTNVLVSALLNMHSNPGQILLSIFMGKTIPILNDEIVNKYREVLAREKFHFPTEQVAIVLKRITASGLNLLAQSNEYPEVVDSKDRCFYAVTMVGRDAYNAMLVTGNLRHFPQKPFIVTPAQFVSILQKEALD